MNKSVDPSEILWRMYQEHCVQARHHETLRGQATNFIIVASGAVLSFTATSKAAPPVAAALGAFVFLLGALGACLCVKHYERHQLHIERARAFRDALDEQLPDFAQLAPKFSSSLDASTAEIARPNTEHLLKSLTQIGDKMHEKRFPAEFPEFDFWPLNVSRLHHWWLSLHLAIAFLGLCLLGWSVLLLVP